MPNPLRNILAIGMAIFVTGAAAASGGEVPACLLESIETRKPGIGNLPVIAIYEVIVEGKQLYSVEYDHLGRKYARAPLVNVFDSSCNAVYKLQVYEYARMAQITRVLWVNSDKKYAKSFANQMLGRAIEAKKWLTKIVGAYFSEDGVGMESITTPQYFAYKSDAMDVESGSEESLSLKAFQDKWRGQFDTRRAGVGEGFLIPAQDWTKVVVEKCALVSVGLRDDFTFHVVLRDEGFETSYAMKIVVRRQGNQYRIADVRSDG